MSDTSDSDSSVEMENGAAEGEEYRDDQEDQDVGLTRCVQFYTTDGRCFSKLPWPQEFNFEHELSRARSKQDSTRQSAGKSSFQLVSVLSNTIHSSATTQYRALYGGEKSRYGDNFRGAFAEIALDPSCGTALQTTRLFIESAPFISVLKSVVTYSTGLELSVKELVIEEPFALIAHHLDQLKEKKRELDELLVADIAAISTDCRPQASPEAARDLEIVLSFMAETVEGRMEKERALHGCEVPLCTFRMLWMLFVPGITVYAMIDGQMLAFVLDSVKAVSVGVFSGAFDKLEDCCLDLWYLDYDGSRRSVSRRSVRIKIKPFMHTRDILSLDAVPCEIWDRLKGGELRSRHEKLGKKWFELLPGKHVHYQGKIYDRQNISNFDGKAFVDPASCYEVSYRNHNLRLALDSGPESDDGNVSAESVRSRKKENANIQWKDLNMDDIERMHETCDSETLNFRYLLVAKRIQAFIFKTREWNTIDVEFCEKPKANRTPFDRLVMPETRKTMIRSLVYKYTDRASKAWSADYIQNKGDGQIFLLHGSPGVGKTFTAECIAELTGQPLLALTCADLGTDEVEMESKLGKWLKLGHKWGAVLLIDEADVLMEKRLHADLKRNSLVSVFLREIEYYRGIMFLTTNRVAEFDDAFISRIHVVIHYDNLKKEERNRIWNQFFDKLEDEKGKEIKIQRSARRYVLENEEVTKFPWNGREIRNAFQTAVALAEYRFSTTPDREKSEDSTAELREEDFKQVCDMAKAFKKYLNDVNDSG